MTELLLIPWFKLQGIPIPGTSLKLEPFGAMVVLGLVVGVAVAVWRGHKTGVPPAAVTSLLRFALYIGVPLAFVLNVVFYHPERLLDFEQAMRYPGLSSYGGFLGGIAGALLFRKFKGMSIAVVGDPCCFAFPFAWAIQRSGCFVVHDHPGRVSDFFLAVADYNGKGLARHDLGLYEVLWSLAAMALFLALGRTRRPRGFFLALLPISYAPIRFFLDFLRASPDAGGDARYLGLTPGQYGSIALFAVGLAVARSIKNNPEPTLYLDGRQ